MADSRDRSALRQVLDEVVAHHLAGNTHATLNTAFAELGMPQVPRERDRCAYGSNAATPRSPPTTFPASRSAS